MLAASASFWLSTIETVPLPEAKTSVVLFAPGIINEGPLPTPETTLAVSWSFVALAIGKLDMFEL